jgi:trimeric autotransporter adhesin
MKNVYKQRRHNFLTLAAEKIRSRTGTIINLLLLISSTITAQNVSYKSNSSPISGINCSAFGYRALLVNKGAHNSAIGYNSLYSNTIGFNNTAGGAYSLYLNTTGNENTGTGFNALYSNTTGSSNTAAGSGALYSNTTGSYNNATGYSALYYNTTGAYNNAYGYASLILNTTGHDNTANGNGALFYNTTGSFNNAFGSSALLYNTTGTSSVAVGYAALYSNTTGNNNTASGYLALYSNTTGYVNTSVGSTSLFFNTSGYANTATGLNALFSNTTGAYNTAVGYNANVSAGYFTNATAIGANALVTSSNKIRLGDANVYIVEGPVYYTVSDGRFKNNISEKDVKGIAFIKLLRPVVYDFDTQKFQEFLSKDLPDSISAKYKNKSFAAATGVRQSGFIAQEVEKAAAVAGYNFNGVHKPENDNDNYSLAYSEFVVPLVKGMQEQQQMIEQLQEQIEELKKIIDSDHASTGSDASLVEGFKIAPNPGNGIFNINIKSKRAGIIEVLNLEGKRIYKTDLTGNDSDYRIDLSGYPKGIYLLSISSNNREICSKKLIIE